LTKCPESGLGLDTIALRGPVNADLLAFLPVKHSRQEVDEPTGVITDRQTSGQMLIRVGRGDVKLHVDARTGVAELRIEFSGPTILRGHNVTPVPLDLIGDLIDGVLTRLADDVPYLPTYAGLRPVRVDVARNLTGIASIPRTLGKLGVLRASRARIDRLERGRSGNLQSLTRGNQGRWLSRLYGKSEQLRDIARQPQNADRRQQLLDLAASAEGVMRWEVQLHGEVLRREGVTGVDDLKPDVLTGMAEDYFRRSRYDATVGGSSVLRDALEELVAQGRQRDASRLCAYLLAESLGIEPPMSRNPANKARSLANRLGVSALDLTSPNEVPSRLDLAAGMQLSGDAAVIR
jgi:hypothetical protein